MRYRFICLTMWTVAGCGTQPPVVGAQATSAAELGSTLLAQVQRNGATVEFREIENGDLVITQEMPENTTPPLSFADISSKLPSEIYSTLNQGQLSQLIATREQTLGIHAAPAFATSARAASSLGRDQDNWFTDNFCQKPAVAAHFKNPTAGPSIDFYFVRDLTCPPEDCKAYDGASTFAYDALFNTSSDKNAAPPHVAIAILNPDFNAGGGFTYQSLVVSAPVAARTVKQFWVYSGSPSKTRLYAEVESTPSGNSIDVCSGNWL